MSKLNRREALKGMALAPFAFDLTRRDVQQTHKRLNEHAQRTAAAGRGAYEVQFFTTHEYRTVQILSDLILPADERSGSATDAGVPDFIDFMMIDRPYLQVPMRGGLAWLDALARKQYGETFAEAAPAEQTALLDRIAYPEHAEPEMQPGVSFFNSFRDLVATGFWTSKMGIEDLQYLGNTFVHNWDGCPDEACDHLGVSYDSLDFDYE